MFNSSILDVAVGLVFVFLALSLVCSAANEGIETFLKQRSKNLEKGIRELLGDLSPPAKSGSPQNRVDQNPTPDQQAPGPDQQAASAAGGNPASDKEPRDFVEALYNHGLINALYRGKYGETPLSKLPSYIPAANFALAVLDLRKSDIPLPRNLQSALDTFEMKAEGNLLKLQRELEAWYDSSMDRVSGWYKRRAQVILAALGLTAAMVVNVDCIDIARRLSTDANLRQSVARISEEAAKHPPQSPAAQPNATNPGTSAPSSSATPTQPPSGQPASSDTQPNPVDQIRTNLANLDGIGLPIGWSEFKANFRAKKAAQAKALQQQGKTPEPEGWFALRIEAGVAAVKLHAIGWGITALAVSLGAPFWFDMLNKVMVIRSTIKPSEKSKEEKSKDPTQQK